MASSYRPHVVLALILCIQAATPAAQHVSITSPRQAKDPHAKSNGQCVLSSTLLTSTQWRLYLSSLQIRRAGGIPVRLLADGTVVSDAISWLRRWRLEPDESVMLLEEDGHPAYRFKFDSERCILASLDCSEGSAAALLGKKGTDFEGYLTAKCPEQFPKGKH